MCSDLCFNWNMKIISQLNQCVLKTDFETKCICLIVYLWKHSSFQYPYATDIFGTRHPSFHLLWVEQTGLVPWPTACLLWFSLPLNQLMCLHMQFLGKVVCWLHPSPGFPSVAENHIISKIHYMCKILWSNIWIFSIIGPAAVGVGINWMIKFFFLLIIHL